MPASADRAIPFIKQEHATDQPLTPVGAPTS
jgi:hypothetical protein